MSARDYLTLLREQAWLIAGFVVLGILAAVALTLAMPKSYASQATFFVVSAGMTGAATSSDNYQGTQMSADRVKSYSELVLSPRVAVDTSTLLDGRLSPEQVQSSLLSESVTDTVLLTVTATDRTPQGANELGRAFTAAFTRLVDEIETTRGPGSPPAFVLQTVQAPTVPIEPVSPRPVLYIPLGAIFGLMLGLGVAVARRSLRHSVATAIELEECVDGPVLASVTTDRATATQPVAVGAELDATKATRMRAEAYRRLRTNVEFAGVDGSARVLMVTSALHDEGKTVTAVNLAAALAAVGRRVLLVEADLRRPTTLTTLGLSSPLGLTTVITGSVSLAQAVLRFEDRFDVLGGGEAPAAPNELFATRRTWELVEQMRRAYDYVLFDTPPALPVADALTLGRHVDGAIIVCRSAYTARDAVRSTATALRSVAVTVVGAVFSHVGDQPRLKPARPVAPTAPAVAEEQPVVDPVTSEISRADLDALAAHAAATDRTPEPAIPEQATSAESLADEPAGSEPAEPAEVTAAAGRSGAVERSEAEVETSGSEPREDGARNGRPVVALTAGSRSTDHDS